MQDETTPLDAAFRAMEAAPQDVALRLRFHERVADAELFVLLEAEGAGAQIRPRVFDLEDGRFVLAFDRDARLAAFLDAPAPYAALAGRGLVAGLAGRGIGIALNAGGAPSETLLSAEAVDWMAQLLAGAPETAAQRPHEIAPPRGVPEALVAALGTKLAAMAGRVSAARLAMLIHADGSRRLALALGGVAPAAQDAVAAAIAEALRFSGAEAGLDVTFLEPEAPGWAPFARHGIAFDLPAPPVPACPQPPGRDPARPPILRRRPRG